MSFSKTIFEEFYDTDSAKQGNWGECFMQHYYQCRGFKVEMNPDVYGWWDLKITNPISGEVRHVQVKTVSRYVVKKFIGITVGITGQTVEAIKQCDDLILVMRTPPTFYDNVYSGKVLRVKEHKWYEYDKKLSQYIIPATNMMENFELITELDKNELNELNRFNP